LYFVALTNFGHSPVDELSAGGLGLPVVTAAINVQRIQIPAQDTGELCRRMLSAESIS
jgi:hypothetical protein